MHDTGLLLQRLSAVEAERDALRQQLDEQAGLIDDLDRLKDELISIASHELKAPLASLRGYAQLLLRHTEQTSLQPDMLAEGLRVIDAQAQAMTRLLDDLLDASRIRAGQFELHPERCDLADCIEAVAARLNEVDRERLRVALGRGPLTGWWERTKIEQVVGNLVGNALKYSPRERSVYVTAERNGHEINVAVSDEGMGIEADDMPRLFQRFYRTEGALASGLPGTGLGLYICRGIVEAHGGRLWAESAGRGLGATFRFTLPLEQAAS